MTSQTFLSDMQAVALQQGQSGNAQQSGLVVQGSSSALAVGASSQPKSDKSHTVLQPSQGQYGGQQFIVTIAADNGSDAENLDFQHSTGQHVIYSGQSYGDYGQNSLYTPVSGTYYQSNGQVGQMSGGLSGQPGGEMYLVHGGSGSVDGDGLGLTHTIRASPATVQWLLDNYETAEGVSLPRSTLYNHYIRHCQEHKLDPMNPASFGKLIRSVFLGLRTRRLGTRGNSQYHYYGIRIKSLSPLNQIGNDFMTTSRQHAFNQAKSRFKTDGHEMVASDGTSGNQPTSAVAAAIAAATSGGGVNLQQQQQHQQFLGDMTTALPDFGHIGLRSDQLPPGVTIDHVNVFEKMYRDHCEAFLEIIFNLQFPLIETLWQSFWRNAPQTELDCDEFDQRLPKDQLYALSEMAIVRQYVCQADYAFYQAIVQVLIPDVLRPIPSMLTQMIRNFAKNLEGWLKNAMTGVPDEMIKTKVGAVSAFAQMLRRYTSLNHLAQAARAVLTNGNQITQMLADINKVDFTNVQEQASWVCQCDDSIVHHLEQDFKKTLQQQTPLEQWASWLEGVVNQALGPYEASPDFPKAARQFLLKWSFYSSMVIRDLTLRSAASFGSFHLIRLLYDEYMFYLVEHKVAAATGETSIAVMGEFRQLTDFGNRSSHEYAAHDDGMSNHITANSQQTPMNFHSYSSPPSSSSVAPSASNGPVIVNGSAFSMGSSAVSGGGVAYYRDAVAHVQSAPGASSLPPPPPAHRVILTAAPSPAHGPISAGRAVIVTGPPSVPSHSMEPPVKRVCVE